MPIEFDENEVAESLDHEGKVKGKETPKYTEVDFNQSETQNKFVQWAQAFLREHKGKLITILGVAAVLLVLYALTRESDNQSPSQPQITHKVESGLSNNEKSVSNYIEGRDSKKNNASLKLFADVLRAIVLHRDMTDDEIKECKIEKELREKIIKVLIEADNMLSKTGRTLDRLRAKGILELGTDEPNSSIDHYYKKAQNETDPQKRKELFDFVHALLVTEKLSLEAYQLVKTHSRRLLAKKVFPAAISVSNPKIHGDKHVELILNNAKEHPGKYFLYTIVIKGDLNGAEKQVAISGLSSKMGTARTDRVRLMIPLREPLPAGFQPKSISVTTTPPAVSKKVLDDWVIIGRFGQEHSMNKTIYHTF